MTFGRRGTHVVTGQEEEEEWRRSSHGRQKRGEFFTRRKKKKCSLGSNERTNEGGGLGQGSFVSDYPLLCVQRKRENVSTLGRRDTQF